jgi:RNA-directed DNA polymerase
MRAAAQTQGKAMYVVTKLDESWLLSEQRKLYERSQKNTEYVFQKLWGLITDPRNLRMGFARVAKNKGSRTAGVDGMTVRKCILQGVDNLLAELRGALRERRYRPSPVRRVLIPKQGQPGKYRALGIPTVIDRVVQAAMKNILEPIFEADFYPCSYGFRPGKSVHGAISHLIALLRPTKLGPPYQWAIEGDIKSCFDRIDHHALMVRLRRRIADAKVNRLVVAFLKAGVLSEEQFSRTDVGTPQGGILSPLLANVALSAIDERYQRYVWPYRTAKGTVPETNGPATIKARARSARQKSLLRGRPVLVPIRYADDFIILVGISPGPNQNEEAQRVALEEKAALAAFLQEELGLELAEQKTLVTPVTESLRFLGHHIRVCNGRHQKLIGSAVVPKDRSQRLRQIIKELFQRSTIGGTLEQRLAQLNPRIRGWAYFFRHARGAKDVFRNIDNYVWWTIFRWLKKKHPSTSMKRLFTRYTWRKPGGKAARWKDGRQKVFEISTIPVKPYRLQWQRPPDYAIVYGKPGAERKLHAGFGRRRSETTRREPG